MGKITGESTSVIPDRKERLRGEIRQTEAEIAETLHTIEERFKPEHIKEEVKGRVRDYSAKTMVRVTEAVRKRPLSFAAIGVGLAWLLVRRAKKRRLGYQPRYTSADVVEAMPKKLRKDPVGSIRNYIKLGRMAVIIGSAVSTYLVRRKASPPFHEPKRYGHIDIEPAPPIEGVPSQSDVQWR